MPYAELIDEWWYSEGEDGQQGRRVFINKSDGTASLPRIGDEFPTPTIFVGGSDDRSKLLCRSYETVIYGRPDQLKYIYHFASKVADDSDITEEEFGDDGPRQLDLSGEELEISGAGKWQWDSDDEDIAFTGDGAIRLTKRIVTGSFTAEVVKTDLPLQDIMDAVGKLNSGVFPSGSGIPAGLWLFIGGTSEEFWNDEGQRRWRIKYHFALKSVTGNPSDGKGWNYVWRPNLGAGGGWDQPINKGTTDPVYKSVDFQTLFTT